MSEECLEGALKVNGRCMEGIWKLCGRYPLDGRYVEDVWKVSGSSLLSNL